VPIYEYGCNQCKTRFEKLVKSMASADRTVCPKCGSEKRARELSVFAVGAEGGKSDAAGPGMCGRCGGPGPCGMN
jgi:putative FmdB family regulatory protein